MRTRTLGGCLATVALVLSLQQAPAIAQPATTPTAGPAAGPAVSGNRLDTHTVTLITGDRVTVSAGSAKIQPGKGRATTRFIQRHINGHLHVIPLDAVPLLQAGRLDARLFDVTTLVESGYDDRRSAELPLIVTGEAARAAAGATGARELPAVKGRALKAAKRDAAAFWSALVAGAAAGKAAKAAPGKVWLDGLRKPTLDVSVPLVGAPAAWQAGYDGTGTTVAVLDTGVDATHPDLAGRVAAHRNFTEGEEDDLDRVGHGTHVASTVAGSGTASGGRYKGVAPGAKLLDGKVCVEFGCAESWIIAGMQWAAEQGADVVNMSLGGFDGPEIDPVEAAVNALTAQFGTLFVVAAGNDGGDGSVSSPSTADAALSVGAVTKADELADFSGRGPRNGDAALKPDLTAPGVDVTAARGKDGFIGTPGEAYATISGTSMATPHVAGAAAILAQRRPDWAPAQLKAALMGSAKPRSDLGAFAQGAGRLDVARAITQQVTADPPGVSFGRAIWPHGDDTPVTKTVTYRNHGTAPVTLNLAVQGGAPPGMFSLSTTSVTVPAGSQAQATLTADTRVGSADGFFGGRLVASAGDALVTTPFAVDREVESYDLTLVHTGRDGQAPEAYFTVLARLDDFATHLPYDPDGTVTLRVPKGVYGLFSDIGKLLSEEPLAFETSVLVQPRLEVTGPLTVQVDARAGRPVRVTVPEADASLAFGEIEATFESENMFTGIGVVVGTFDNVYSAQLGPDQPVSGFNSKVSGAWARLDADHSARNSPFSYHAAYPLVGRMFTGLERRITPRDLATVKVRYGAQLHPTGIQWIGSLPAGDHIPPIIILSGIDVALPSTRTAHFTTEGRVRWLTAFDEILFDERGFPVEFTYSTFGGATTYQAGRTYVENWNRAVFGPGFDRPFFPIEFVTRAGDTMYVLPALFSDSEGRAGFAPLSSARAALFRDGTKIGEMAEPGGVFEVPAAAGRYRLELSAQRIAGAPVSTQVSGVWTFRSGHVDGEDPVRLPLWTVGFAPDVDAHQTAPADRLFTVPVTAVVQPGPGAGRLKKLAVEVSYDDGRTWRSVPVVTTPSGQRVVLKHPAGDGFVSLRASAADDKGNTVQQTVIRAYRIG